MTKHGRILEMQYTVSFQLMRLLPLLGNLPFRLNILIRFHLIIKGLLSSTFIRQFLEFSFWLKWESSDRTKWFGMARASTCLSISHSRKVILINFHSPSVDYPSVNLCHLDHFHLFILLVALMRWHRDVFSTMNYVFVQTWDNICVYVSKFMLLN